MSLPTRTHVGSALIVLLLLGGCAAEYEGAFDLEDTPGGELMTRYVSMGNSITAGFQSGGLTDSLQLLAYPNLVALQAGVPFALPLVADPGCPPPFREPILLANTRRIDDLPGSTCALRDERLLLDRPIQNVAFVGSFIGGAIDIKLDANPLGANVYKTLLLGGRSQVEAMQNADPTFVSVWLGNNETLGTVTDSLARPGLLLPQAAFEAALDSIIRAIRATEAQGAALIAPVNALSFAPRVQPGAFYFLARAAGQLAKPVGLSCAPGTPGGRAQVAFDVVGDARYPTIECNEDSPYTMSQAEAIAYDTAVSAYKTAVRTRAVANGWIFIDPDVTFAADLADPSKNRKCQGLVSATISTSPLQLQQAVATTCPSSASPFFGSWISFDAAHPANPAHRAIANELIRSINATYGRTIPLLLN